MFNFIKNTLTKIYTTFTSKAHELFARTNIDEGTLKELETLLIQADTGVQTTRTILNNLQKQIRAGMIAHGDDLKKALEEQLIALLQSKTAPHNATVFLLVGINGSGKTTCAAKLAYKLQQENKKVLLAAADTFRAAATEQLQQWANRMNIPVVVGTANQDPASVVFAACEQYKNGEFDALIIDTAGRLQTKVNLMKELEKIKKIITRQLPNHTICTLLTVDAMLGQNSLEQAQLFNEATAVDGIVMTKMDGTGKGGIVFAINQTLHIPIAYISYGEKIEQLKEFAAQEYVEQLLAK